MNNITQIDNRVVRYYLNKWGHLERNFYDLSPIEEVRAKTLYSSLKNLDKSDLQLLADKYRTEKTKGKKSHNDLDMADKYNMTIKDYRIKRIAVESKLNPYLQRNIELYSEELSEAIRMQHSKIQYR